MIPTDSRPIQLDARRAPAHALTLSLVIPVHNEEANVGPLLAAIEAVHGREAADQSWEVVLVDDGSTDATVRFAGEAAEGLRLPVTVLQLQRNFGQTAAMQAGIDAARGRLIATLDGDLQNDPADIPRMVRHLESDQLDLLVGHRQHRQDGWLLRLVPSWIANRLIARVTRIQIRDNGCSLKVFRSSAIRRIRLTGEMHRFIPAWLATVVPESRIGEIAVRHHARRNGVSKYGISRTLRVLLDLLTIQFFLRFRARPGHFFGQFGIAVGLLGVASFAFAAVAWSWVGGGPGVTAALCCGAAAMLAATQFVALGVLAEMVSRIYHALPEQPAFVVRETRVWPGHDAAGGAGTQDRPAGPRVIPIEESPVRTASSSAGPIPLQARAS